jgi:quercetin dioxygenase-like cupin family protein
MKKSFFALLVCVLALLSWEGYALYSNQFVKATPLLKTATSWDGEVLHYPAGAAEVSAMIVELVPGGETGWHLHTVPSVAVMLEGEIEVHLKDGRVKPLKQGESLAEVVNTLHNGKNTSDKPARMAVFYAGAVEKQLTLSEAEAALKDL